MKIIADLPKGRLFINGAYFTVSCSVRTLAEGSRRTYEVIRSIPENLPYDPRPFPKGLWNVTGIERRKNSAGKVHFDYATYGPLKIRTDAYQMVNVWALDRDGDYLHETSALSRDEGYLLHYSESKTTLGCIRLASPDEAEIIAGVIEKALKNGAAVQLEVVNV